MSEDGGFILFLSILTGIFVDSGCVIISCIYPKCNGVGYYIFMFPLSLGDASACSYVSAI